MNNNVLHGFCPNTGQIKARRPGRGQQASFRLTTHFQFQGYWLPSSKMYLISIILNLP
jgi:hypothetical protein